MEEKVFELVNKANFTIRKDSMFIVWSCYILGNRKFLVGCVNEDLYFEVTYNKNKDEWYVDEYNKIKNTKFNN